MKKVIDFFKNRIVISLIGIVALCILLWFGGPYIKFGEDNAAPLAGTVSRLIGIIILVIIWGLNNLRLQMLDKKQNEVLVEDLQESKQDVRQDMTNGQTVEELQQINERFSQALSTLKKLKFKGRGAKKALYELPWYIIIGPPGAGKTTALVNSSLDFPLAEQFGKGALQGIGGTRNCDWWFTNEAVLIDTAGRYTTQDSHKIVDSSAWEGFLSLLKRNRRRRPINGAIISISIQDLLTQTEEERIQQAKIIRSRIDELMEKLEIRFPIYLVFTKADLVSGFSEFFEDLGKEEREQVWGLSLPNAPKPSQSPDFDFMSDEYGKLIDRLYERVLFRVHQERDVKRRAAIQGFPRQMENLQMIINDFVRQTFVKNRYQFQPYLRGLYFSSGTQDGTPIDRIMTSISSAFGFAAEIDQPGYGQGKSYFLGHLFREVIFPESELVGSNRKFETLIRWGQRAGYAGIALFAVILITIWASSITRNKIYLHKVQDYLTEFKAEQKRMSSWSKDIRNVLPSLNALARASIVYDQEEHPWLAGMGLYDGLVDANANKAYAEQLRGLMLPAIIADLEAHLKQGHLGGDLYSTFRVYLMFQKTKYMDKELIRDWFESSWAKGLKGEGTSRQELSQHLQSLLALDLPVQELNPRIVKQVRALLLRVPVSQRIYGRIKANPDYRHKVDMLNQFGESVRTSYETDEDTLQSLQTPLMFTKEGYDMIDLSTGSPVISDIVNDRWVLEDDESARVDFIKDDLEEISKKVKDHYLSDYLSHWNKIFQSLDVNEFKNLKQATDVLASFTDPVYSPLISILQVASQNTTLSSDLLTNLADDHDEGKKGKATQYLAKKFEGNKVDKQFRNIHVLLRETSKKPAPINLVVSKIQQLHDFLGEMAVAPDPSKAAFQVARARFQSGAGNAITSLRAFSKNSPQPLKRWLYSLADESWKVVLRSARHYVNAEWKTQVYNPYIQGLAGRFPLKRNARDELALFDFSEFFKPTGIMDGFYLAYMKPFINTRKGWKNRVIDKHSLGFSKKTISQVRKALNIKNVFFRQNPAVPSLSFQLKPYRLNKKDARFTLELGDKRIAYNHGPKFWKTLTWSGEDENKRVRLIFEDLNEELHSISFEGPWAWFRLQDKSKLKKTTKSNIYLATYTVVEDKKNSGGKGSKITHSVSYEIKAKSVNNPFGKNLLSTFKCPESI